MFAAARHTIRLIICCAGLLLLLLAAACKKEDQQHAGPLKPEIIPASDTLRHMITANTLLTSARTWYIDGWVYVGNESSLRIEPGAIIHILPSAVDRLNGRHSGGLVITRGAMLHAAGTPAYPIRFVVSEKEKTTGASGIILLGKAPVRNKAYITENPATPVLSELAYGGDLPDDSSGVLQHVTLTYTPVTGKIFNGGLLLLGTGSRTIIRDVAQERRTALKPASLR